MPRRTLHRQLLSIGDSPDGGWGSEPDIIVPPRAVNSDMSPLTEDPRRGAAAMVIETSATFFAAQTGWRPAINAYRCDDKFVVFVELAGVPPESVELRVQADRLVIRGRRPTPEPDGRSSDQCHLLALEIDQGAFERTLDLPLPVNPDATMTEYRDGLLRIAIGLRT